MLYELSKLRILKFPIHRSIPFSSNALSPGTEIRPPFYVSKNLFSTTRQQQTVNRVLITGGLGQLGRGIASSLRSKLGDSNVFLSDIKDPDSETLKQGPFVRLDIIDKESIEKTVFENKIDGVIHLSAILSALGEKHPQKAIEVNIRGAENILDIAKNHNLRIFIPSSMGAFGPSTVKDSTPDLTIMRPNTLYGIAKVYMELMGEYYNQKNGLDFRSLRYPGIISGDTPPGGGTTDYAVDIFHAAIEKNQYTCFLKKDTYLAMMYVDDCISETIKFFLAPREQLSQCVYNVDAISFSPEELSNEIKKQWSPEFEISYKPDYRQKIADTWPRSMCDSKARSDWNFYPKLTSTSSLVSKMLSVIKRRNEYEK
ncbi:hypothetical protein BB560_004196 [Smittium megazygosporum]|uniref:L-threonine 3-dehydrogenase, mitochondrial n=1 Tax=Smittium megazygosporum TaxID=133381 RepID=A0A2T9Z9Z5_9FUNG|nr:hypothetical protein BB560_004196 [Smittium megazygosporum]